MGREDFIQVFQFQADESKPGRVLSSVKIGKVYMSRLVIQSKVTTGNYYHKKTRVMFYVGRGHVVGAFEHVLTGERKEMGFSPGKHVVHIPRYVAHATKNIGKEEAVLVFFSTNPLRMEGDCFPHVVL